MLIAEGLADLADFEHELVHADTLAKGVLLTHSSEFDVVLLDLGLPGTSGIETFERFHEQCTSVPVLVLTGLDDFEVSMQALHSGAQDYVIKRDIQSQVLSRAIRYAVERSRLGGELERSRDRLRLLTQRLQAAREEERLRISRELHDELGQKISAMKMDLRAIETRLKTCGIVDGAAVVHERVGESLILADEAISTVQRIAFQLRPSVLDHLGLVGAIREEARRFEGRSGIEIKLVLPDDFQVVDPELNTMFFRVFQELLTNIARHAQASAVTVRFAAEAGQLSLDVTDDGVGMPGDVLEANSSLGLLGMQERVAAHKGRIFFDSIAGEGTSVCISVPDSGVAS
jgi:signal transduction histidine kinase